jgi:uncharacterized protein (TIGR02266 family)
MQSTESPAAGGDELAEVDRRSPRCDLVLKVEYESLGQLRRDYLTSLGSGGLHLHTEFPLQVGQVLQMTVSFPSGFPPLAISGVVRWRAADRATPTPPGVGVEFTDLSAETRARIEQLIARAGAAPLEPTLRPLHAVLLETNIILRDIASFQMRRFAQGTAGKPVWDLDLTCVTDIDGLMAALASKPCQIAILDFETLSHAPKELIDQLRATPAYRHLPIIVLGDDLLGIADPRTMYVKKPFSVKPLFTTLQMLLDA